MTTITCNGNIYEATPAGLYEACRYACEDLGEPHHTVQLGRYLLGETTTNIIYCDGEDCAFAVLNSDKIRNLFKAA